MSPLRRGEGVKMTRRERLERKLELRHEWAEKREARAGAEFQKSRAATEGIPFGQPILIGHHSEGRHRAAIARADSAMARGVECAKMAAHHENKADGIEAQLDGSIFSDDPDAVEAIEAKAAAIDAECERMTACNRAFRKNKGAPGWGKLAGLSDDDAAKAEAEWARLFAIVPYQVNGCAFPAYAISNRRANARRLRERIKDITRRQENTKAAAAAGGVLVRIKDDWASVTFAEKPDRAVIDELKAAGFGWGGGRWSGYANKLPERFRNGGAS